MAHQVRIVETAENQATSVHSVSSFMLGLCGGEPAHSTLGISLCSLIKKHFCDPHRGIMEDLEEIGYKSGLFFLSTTTLR